MFARSIFSQKQLHKKKNHDIHEMLFEKGYNWTELPDVIKNGTIIMKDGRRINEKFVYDGFNELLGIKN